MRNKFASTALRRVALVTVVMVLYVPERLPSASSIDRALADDAPQTERYTITPPSALPGQDDFQIAVKPVNCIARDMESLTLGAPTGKTVTIKSQTVTKDGCTLFATIAIAAKPTNETVIFPLLKGTKVEASVRFEVTEVQRGPIPPGLKGSQVDVMWTVVPKSIEHDNFGHAIAKKYYCVEVVIGNNTGFELQIASVGFTLNNTNADPEDANQEKLPTSSYLITRGTLERSHDVGRRATTVNIIKALGPLLTGLGFFFHEANPKANYAQGVNIFSNPFEKGAELIFPDTTIRQLLRLDGQMLRDGIVIPNNTQTRTVVFFPKDLLKNEVSNADDPSEVRDALGQLVLVGDIIRHLERVRVVSTPPPGPRSPLGEAQAVAEALREVQAGLELTYMTPTGQPPVADPAKDQSVNIRITGDKIAGVPLELQGELAVLGRTETKHEKGRCHRRADESAQGDQAGQVRYQSGKDRHPPIRGQGQTRIG